MDLPIAEPFKQFNRFDESSFFSVNLNSAQKKTKYLDFFARPPTIVRANPFAKRIYKNIFNAQSCLY